MTGARLEAKGEPMATDLLLEYKGDPAALDRTLTSMPIPCALVQGEAAPGYLCHDGHYVARVFGDPRAFKFFVENQGYCRVISELDELL